jgi:stalled ribosome rescue protein Dom34
MAIRKKIGVWMNHTHAHIKAYTNMYLDKAESTDREHKHMGESNMHHNETKEQSEFYNLIGKEILDYNDILIFGPNDAKTELYNHLKADSKFEDVNIELKNAGKLSDVQERAVIKAHFK